MANLAVGTPCFGSDYQDSYAASAAEIGRYMDMELYSAVNAGLVVLCKDNYDLDRIEEYFAGFQGQPADICRHEQTAYAILLSKSGAERLDANYQISQQAVTQATVSHHFVSDGSRIKFITTGVRKLGKLLTKRTAASRQRIP